MPISKRRQEKLLCYYFYADSISRDSCLEVLMEGICDSPNFPIDFASDCIVRRPNVYLCEAYITLLETILIRSWDESSKIKLGEDAFAIIEHVVEFICSDKNKDNKYWVSSARPSAEELSKLLNDVKEKGLIRPVCFNKYRLMRLANRHLRSNSPYYDFSDYVSSVNKLMKENAIESFVKDQGLKTYDMMVERPYVTIGSTVAIFAAISIFIFKTRF